MRPVLKTCLNIDMTTCLTAVVCCLLGCGGDDGDSGDSRLQGLWAAQVPGATCELGFFFEGQNYEFDLACLLNDGTYGLEAEVGTYEADGSRITFFPMQATCPDVSPDPQEFGYGFVNGGQTLRIVGPSGAGLYDRVDRDGEPMGGAFVSFGCFDRDLVLTERPLQNI